MQLTFGDAEGLGQRKRTRKEIFLAEMEQVVPWNALLKLIEPHYPKMGRPGRQPYAVATMLRIHFLQQWYALSDPAMEEALYDTAVLRRFAGLSGLDNIPDETTILNFRRLLYPILLIGIAVKNSILLVDYAVMAEEKGMTRHEALMDACHKRARPVIMTTLAMGAGMMPIALGLTADSSFRMPMAVAVIGGLITSTVLSLVVVPAAYTLVDDLEERVLGKLRRKAADASEVAAPP